MNTWELKDPKVGQECVVLTRIGRLLRLCHVKNLTPAGRVRTDDGVLYEPDGNVVERHRQSSITNDPKAVKLFYEQQATENAARQKHLEWEAKRKADPRWPIACRLNWQCSTDDTFDKLSALTSDELEQFSALLAKIEGGKV